MRAAESTVIVIGAGVVGLATALFLQRAGKSVTVIDPFPPPGGCSFGNAGMISSNHVAPMAMPGMLRKVPGWLLDPDGPLVIRKRYMLSVAPWLIKWLGAGRLDRVLAISDAMRQLAKNTHTHWRDLVGPQRYAELIRPDGQVHLAEGGMAASRHAEVERMLRVRHGIPVEALGAADVRAMFPGIAPDVTHGYLIPGNGYTINPGRLVASIAEAFVQAGGALVPEKALKLMPSERGLMVMTNVGNHSAADIVVAGGASSVELLRPLGIEVPLEAERGYHAMLTGTGLCSLRPLVFKSRGFAMTPMENGVRVAGTIEFAGLHACPDERRAWQLVAQAKRLFPDLRYNEASIWSGERPSFPDSLPVIGPVASIPGLHLAFGNGSTGMTTGPATARIAANLVLRIEGGIDSGPYRLDRPALAS